MKTFKDLQKELNENIKIGDKWPDKLRPKCPHPDCPHEHPKKPKYGWPDESGHHIPIINPMHEYFKKIQTVIGHKP